MKHIFLDSVPIYGNLPRQCSHIWSYSQAIFPYIVISLVFPYMVLIFPDSVFIYGRLPRQCFHIWSSFYTLFPYMVIFPYMVVYLGVSIYGHMPYIFFFLDRVSMYGCLVYLRFSYVRHRVC